MTYYTTMKKIDDTSSNIYTNLTSVPLSKFIREQRKWIRQCQIEDILITKRNVPYCVLMGYPQYQNMMDLLYLNDNKV